MLDGKEWAEMIRRGATDPDAVIRAINTATADGSNRGAVLVACAYVLAQSIVSAGPQNADAIRAGIMALIDGYAMQVAVGDA